VIDVGRQPELKMQLLNGQLNVAVCPNCGAGGQLTTPMVYHDPAHELFMIYIPTEMNMNQMQREQFIGQMTRQVMEATPQEQRRAYMFQAQTILTMQTFMEKVLETEGVTKEMIERQKKQSELLQTLARADGDVVEYLIKERASEIDETFFAMLQSYIETASQMNDNQQLLPLINLRAKLMTGTKIGQELEKQQVALHTLNQDAKKANGLSPKLLLKHILKNLESERIVDTMVSVGQAAINYEFFQLLTAEIDKVEKLGDTGRVGRLTQLRDDLLELQEAMRQESQRMVTAASQTLQTILDAPDKKAAIAANIEGIDDAFMYVLSNRIAQADENGRADEAQALNQIYQLIMQQAQQQAPPEVQLLNSLMSVETEAELAQILDQNKELLSPELLQVIDMIRERARAEGQGSVDGRLRQIKTLIEARL
jgi:hypothetical protein